MNWIVVTVDDLKAVALEEVVNAARGLVAAGQPDPAATALADAVLAVRVAVAAGNALDANAGSVPGSLRALTARTAAFALFERGQIELNADQRATRATDLTRLERLREERQRVEPADQPLPANGGTETVADGNAGHGREELKGI